MIVLSNSIPKTGSTILASYKEDMLKVSGRPSGQETLRSLFGSRYISSPTSNVLVNLSKIDQSRGSIIVKCHWGIGKSLHAFCRLLNVRMTFAYRDPRDMILSMIDHGERTRNGQDPSGAFSDCYNVKDLIPRTINMMESLAIFEKQKYVLPIRYEDLMSKPVDVLQEINQFIGWSIERADLSGIVDERHKTKASSLNFNKGTVERWRTEMNQDEKELCLEAFESYLTKLGYELD